MTTLEELIKEGWWADNADLCIDEITKNQWESFLKGERIVVKDKDNKKWLVSLDVKIERL